MLNSTCNNAGRVVSVRGEGLLFTLHHGETIGSIYNRLWPRIGRTSATALARELTSSTSPVPAVSGMAPRGITLLAGLLGIDPIDLVCSHTLIPYYESAHPLPELGEFARAVFDQDSGKRRYSSTWKRQPVQFCLMCVKSDVELLGEPYLRRAHQLPGATVCARHRFWLTRSCNQCGWEMSKFTLSYPAEACPHGHSLQPQKPDGAFELDREVEFALWSEELLAFRPGERLWPLYGALHGIACEVGLHGLGRKLQDTQLLHQIAATGHPLLIEGQRLLSRVTKKACGHVLCPAMNSSRARLHPVAVMLCVKALLGPQEHTLRALRGTDPANLSPRRKWLLVCRSSMEVRLRFLVDFASSRMATAGMTASTLEADLTEELGMTAEVLRAYMSRSPELSRCLGQHSTTTDTVALNTDPYATEIQKRELHRLLAVLRKRGTACRSESLRGFTRDFARQAGISSAVLGDYIRRSPMLAERISELRLRLVEARRDLVRRYSRRVVEPAQWAEDNAPATAGDAIAAFIRDVEADRGMRKPIAGRERSHHRWVSVDVAMGK